MSKQTWKPGNMLYPVPAVMVSCQRESEKPNIITVAWAGTICSDPAMVSISVRKERYSHDIIKDSGEFVVNLTTRSYAMQLITVVLNLEEIRINSQICTLHHSNRLR